MSMMDIVQIVCHVIKRSPDLQSSAVVTLLQHLLHLPTL